MATITVILPIHFLCQIVFIAKRIFLRKKEALSDTKIKKRNLFKKGRKRVLQAQSRRALCHL